MVYFIFIAYHCYLISLNPFLAIILNLTLALKRIGILLWNEIFDEICNSVSNNVGFFTEIMDSIPCSCEFSELPFLIEKESVHSSHFLCRSLDCGPS